MQKSLYQEEVFSQYWNERAGVDGEVYKRYILDPLMFSLMGKVKGKIIIELGCGNGYLAPKFLAQKPEQVIMMDISKYNLQHAANKTKDKHVTFLEQDATVPWQVQSSTVDVVYSNMMLNEVEDSQTVIQETYRVLKKDGIFVFSVTHPAWDLYEYAKESVGIKSKKIVGLGNYFRRGFTHFMMGNKSKTSPQVNVKYNQEFSVEHYQRPLSDYFNQLVDAGFSVDRLLEPELTEELLHHTPRFADYKDHPVGLIFFCRK
jgi:SAM-dependent methyltransferase